MADNLRRIQPIMVVIVEGHRDTHRRLLSSTCLDKRALPFMARHASFPGNGELRTRSSPGLSNDDKFEGTGRLSSGRD